MRLRRLDLTRYGRFTDAAIDFGEVACGAPDLHIVYGPNEAGKSTALSAFLDLLFGIDGRSRYNFLHPYQTMRIGAALELSGEVHELARIKRPQRSLLDARGQPVAEGFGLGGLDRASYRSMFSLDDETLEAGGESILASKGDLGQLLFAASAGLADLSRTLVELRAQADGFYRFHARSGELAQHKQALAELKTQREQIDTLASDYARLATARDVAAGQYEAALAERGKVQARMEEVERLLSALPRMAALRGLRQELADLAGLAEAPAGWAAELPRLQVQEVELATGAAAISAEIARGLEGIEAIELDEPALGLWARWEGLAPLRARHATAEVDIPDREQELREVDGMVADALRRLERAGEAEPARLLLDVAQTAALRELIASRSGIAQALAVAQDEHSDALQKLEDAHKAMHGAVPGAIPGAPHGAGEAGLAGAAILSLSTVLQSVRDSDHALRLRKAGRDAAALRARLGEQVASLRPWSGGSDELADLVVPDAATVDGWKAALPKAAGVVDRHAGELERLDADRVRLRAELSAAAGVGLVDDLQAAAIRAEREAGWAEHRRRLDDASAEAFEAALRADDRATAMRLGHAAELARLHEAARGLAVVEAECRRVERLLGLAVKEHGRLQGEMAAAGRAMGAGELAPAQLESWLARRETTLQTASALRDAEREGREAGEDADALVQRLRHALEAAGIPVDAACGMETLAAVAQSAVAGEASRVALREAVGERQNELKRRERVLQKAATADQAWRKAWSEACAATWLAELKSPPGVAVVGEMLSALGALSAALQQQASLAGRLRDMRLDQSAYAASVAGIAGLLGIDSDDTIAAAGTIETRIRSSLAARDATAVQQRALGEARQRLAVLAEAQGVLDRRKAAMTGLFGVDGLADVGVRLEEIVRRDALRSQLASAEREVLEMLRVGSIGEAEAAMERADRSALELERTSLRARFEDQDRRTRDLFSESSKAADRIASVGGDDAAAVIEERRRTLLLEIEEKARVYLRLRLGVAAAEQALRLYRDTHRSAMMARASEAFRLLSRDAYRGLGTRPEKEGDVLIALGADGGSKMAADLSKGTRFQLYLALRAAGYDEFCRMQDPVPFIADDIMETFDDFRAEEAFRLFAGMAGTGQVIYLTHHLHLLDIARRVVPGVRIHELAPAMPRGQLAGRA